MLGEVLTAIVTPFRSDGSVDFHRFAALAHHLVEQRLGRARRRRHDRRVADTLRRRAARAIRVALGAVGDRATVIAGTGTYSTAHSIHLTHAAHELGVDGFLVVTPYYNKPPQRGIVEHFKAIADVSDRPIVVYNIPGRVVINIEPETIVELARDPDASSAVKQANDDLHQARRIVEEAGLDLYAGDDNLIFPFLELGGVGGVCVHTHVVGPQVKEMVRLYKQGDHVEARRIDEATEPAYELLKVAVESDRDQGRAEPARPRRRRSAPAARRGDRGRAPRPRLPRAARRARLLASPAAAC